MQDARLNKERKEEEQRMQHEEQEKRATELPAGVKKYMASRNCVMYGPNATTDYRRLGINKLPLQ